MQKTQNVNVKEIKWGKSKSLNELGESVLMDWMGSDEAKDIEVKEYGVTIYSEELALLLVNKEHGVVIPIPITPEMFDLFCKEAGVA